jgi:serine phosphatase RsbU (regulator of sigma subunit)
MQKLLLKIITIGIRPGYNEDIIEKTKLVNGISLVGVPICFFLGILFLFNGLYIHAAAFAFGVLVFLSTLPVNKLLGLKIARSYICIMAPLSFGFVNLISGKDSGFYMGFIVTTIPTLLVFDSMKESFLYMFISVFILSLSLIGLYFFPPLAEIKFAMYIHIINLFTVIIATLTVVYIFKKELNESKAKIEEKQEEILDSIHYAKRIQNTLITNKDFISQYLPNNFIYFQPKDIVSGDFYWATKNGSKFYLAVCDSTGHGVPGAFMSLLNITFLNEAINQNNILEPNEIFNYTRKKLIENLGKDGQKDGFDGILICIDQNTKSISYAAANNSPIAVSDGKTIKLPCDKMPVGQGERTSQFTLNMIDLKPNDVLYLYTDGFADQFGGPKGKKYKYKPLNDLLELNSKCNLDIQGEILEKEFASWKGNLEQVDDVCIIGIRL